MPFEVQRYLHKHNVASGVTLYKELLPIHLELISNINVANIWLLILGKEQTWGKTFLPKKCPHPQLGTCFLSWIIIKPSCTFDIVNNLQENYVFSFTINLKSTKWHQASPLRLISLKIQISYMHATTYVFGICILQLVWRKNYRIYYIWLYSIKYNATYRNLSNLPW